MHVSTTRIRLAIPRSSVGSPWSIGLLLGWVAIPLLLWGWVIGREPLLLLLVWRLPIALACWRWGNFSVLGSCKGEDCQFQFSLYSDPISTEPPTHSREGDCQTAPHPPSDCIARPFTSKSRLVKLPWQIGSLFLSC